MTRALLLLLVLTCCASLPAQENAVLPRADHYIDHVVLGIDDLDKGVEALERLTGVRAKFDGRDPRMGTQSAVISLGGKTHLEILAPDPKADPGDLDPELAELFLEPLHGFSELAPFSWAVGSGNLDISKSLARRTNCRTSQIEPGSRKRGWWRRTEWTWSRVVLPPSYVMPVLVRWDDDTKPPQTRAPGGCVLKRLELDTVFYKTLHSLLVALQVDVESERADRESITLTLECNGEEVVLAGAPLPIPDYGPD